MCEDIELTANRAELYSIPRVAGRFGSQNILVLYPFSKLPLLVLPHDTIAEAEFEYPEVTSLRHQRSHVGYNHPWAYLGHNGSGVNGAAKLENDLCDGQIGSTGCVRTAALYARKAYMCTSMIEVAST